MKTMTRFLLTLFAINLVSTYAIAQWTRTGFSGKSASVVAISGTKLFVGTNWGSNGIFLSTNLGVTWTAVNNGLPKYNSSQYFWINALVFIGTDLFAATGKGVFRSTNDGTSWMNVSYGLSGGNISALVAMGTHLYAGGAGVFLSTNSGASWTAVNNGLLWTDINCLAVKDLFIFAGTTYAVFLSTNSGSSWGPVTSGLGTAVVNELLAFGDNLFAATTERVYLSTNNATVGILSTMV